eukprot:PhF_6_TR32336/c1_g1_i1/m.47933/K01363/CTSB; cathepsin B
MRIALVLVISLVCIQARRHGITDTTDPMVITPSLIEEIRSKSKSWTPVSADDTTSRFHSARRSEVRRLLGVRETRDPSLLPWKSYPTNTSLPPSFDSATNWPHCATISMIRDQSDCGSCWAFGAAESISDRYCTYNPKPINITISPNNLVACCDLSSLCGEGCGGGEPTAAWYYWTTTGLVDEGCDPYPFPPCEHHTTGKYPACPDKVYPNPKCVKQCKNTENWNSALHKGNRSWNLKGESAYMQELFAHGPFEVAFDVYEDFISYKSGVYSHVTGAKLGGHAVKVVGWGTLNGTDYWKIANSWNQDWGMQGYFLIKRGTNECGIEKQGTAGQP